jgi:hypothetical protein
LCTETRREGKVARCHSQEMLDYAPVTGHGGVMFARLFKFLQNDTNRAVLGWIGGCAVTMATAAWAVFIYLHPAVPAHPPEPANDRHSPTDTTTTGTIMPESKGWAYFGSQANGKWFDKHFEVQSAGNRAPRSGDTIVASIPTNIRQGPIEDTASGWANQPKVGSAKAGDQFRVDRVVEVYPGFYWVEIRPL